MAAKHTKWQQTTQSGSKTQSGGKTHKVAAKHTKWQQNMQNGSKTHKMENLYSRKDLFTLTYLEQPRWASSCFMKAFYKMTTLQNFRTLWLLFMNEFQLPQAYRTTTRRQFTF